jgi:surfeit locus 1 family protein
MRLRPGSLALALAVLAGALICVRLGFWQLSRLGEKRAWNARLRETLAAPPETLQASSLTAEFARIESGGAPRRIALRGEFDETRHVLLRMRMHEERTGVAVVTPFRLPADSLRLLVQRGWLPAEDGVTARPQDAAEPGPRVVTGVLEPIGRANDAGWHTLEADSLTLWSARSLHRDSLARALPDARHDFMLLALPAPGAPERPLREPLAPADEAMHAGYAIQWFGFAAVGIVGALALLRSGARVKARK